MSERLRIAVQKKGRLHSKSTELLEHCGLALDGVRDQLLSRCRNFPLDLLLVRDDDIPEYVRDGICQLGIVGENLLHEKIFATREASAEPGLRVLRRLDFGYCRLAIAVPKDSGIASKEQLHGMRIATSYPQSLSHWLREQHLEADIVEIGGAVEITPALGVADAVCDLVSTGTTLAANGLHELETLLESRAVVVANNQSLESEQHATRERLLVRIEGVQRAASSKYIMMNAPKSALGAIRELLPGLQAPTVIPLDTTEPNQAAMVAVHAVAPENVFWETMEQLEAAGARSILVVPIEKILG